MSEDLERLVVAIEAMINEDGITPGNWSAIAGVEQHDERRCGIVTARGKYQYLIAVIENGAPGDTCDTEMHNAAFICLMRNNAKTIAKTLRAHLQAQGKQHDD